jgi:formate hydrogenlyase subunit 6/NADH:ubiquinone oxidoreductase subunit I
VTNIFSIVFKNLSATPETRRFPKRVAPEGRYRGAVIINTERCIACSLCDRVCVSGAIELRDFPDHAEWNYDPGRCTFCARCVTECPVGALKQEPDALAIYESPGALAVNFEVAYPKCEECGAIAFPLRGTAEHPLPPRSVAEIRADAKLCAKCRAKASREASAEKPAEASSTTEAADSEENIDER